MSQRLRFPRLPAGEGDLSLPRASVIGRGASGRLAVEPSCTGCCRAIVVAAICMLWVIGGGFLPTADAQQPGPLWSFAGGDVRIREVTHRVESKTGSPPYEQLVIEAGTGTAAYYLCAVQPAPVIAELRVRLPVWADRPGIQVFLSVVLPRVRHPQTGMPLSLLVPGTQTRVAGQWEWLTVSDVPAGLEREARAIRLQIRREVDLREAYVNGVVLNVYGGPGRTQLLIGPVEWTGYLPGQVAGGNPAILGPNPGVGDFTLGQGSRQWMNTVGGVTTAAWSEPSDDAAAQPPLVEMAGNVLRVQGRPFFPRALEYQGEPLDLVKTLGFNTLWIRSAVNRDLLLEARRQGLWVILHPDETLLPSGGVGGRTIGTDFHGVLAWDLGTQSSLWEVQALQQRAETLRGLDPSPTRPLIAEPLTDMLRASRAVDALLVGRGPCFSEMEFSDYIVWLRSRSLLARPGTPIWVAVQTQPDPAVLQQWQQAGASGERLDCIPADQVRLLTYLSLIAGARAILFRSHSSLALADDATRQRRLSLELMNRELEWIEPFLAGGQFVALVPSNVPEVVGALFRAERARLLVPLWLGKHAQYVPGQAAVDEVTFVVPGVPESSTAYLLLPGSLEPVNSDRVAGGTRITLREFGPTSLVVLTQDPVVLNYVMDRARGAGPRIVQLERELADFTFRNVKGVHDQLIREGPFIPQAEAWFRLASEELASADRAAAAGDNAAAFRHIHRALRPLLLIRRIDWESVIPARDPIVTWPLATRFDTLPWLRRFQEQLNAAVWGDNRLPGGDFESAEQLTAIGWEPFQHGMEGIAASAEVTASAARSGRMGLLLSVRGTQPHMGQALVESPPLWVHSPPVSVRPGDWVQIEGWVFIPRPITGSVDGLMIVDSLGGDTLAHRISQTTGWRPFRMYRRVGEESTVRISFVLTGLGEVCIDDVAVRTVSAASPQSPPPQSETPLVPVVPPSRNEHSNSGPLARLPFLNGWMGNSPAP